MEGMGAVGASLDKKKGLHSISFTSEAGPSPSASPCDLPLVDHFPFLSGEKIVPKVTFDRYPCLLKNLDGYSKPPKKKHDASFLSSPCCDGYKEHEDDLLFSRYKKRLNDWIHGDETWASNSFCESFDFNEMNQHNCQATFTHLFSQIQFHSLNELLRVPHTLWMRLFPHQQKALEFLGTLHKNMMGCIIADEMGLGKTAQMIVFLGALHFSSYCPRTISCNSDFQDDTWGRSFLNNVLILCPATLVQQWLRELHKWYPPFRCYLIFSKCLSERDRFSRIIQEPGSVSIMSYETMRNGVMFFGTLSFTYVILDEGQKIRNPESGVTIAVKKLQAAYRIILSGTPIQNNLKEFWSLFDFVSPQRLGSLTSFAEKFADPIRAGGLANATHSQVLAAQKSAEALRSIISPYFLRRTKEATLDNTTLPEKSEHILFCRISPAQFQIYSEFIQHQRLMFSRKIYSGRQLFSLKRYLFFTLSVLRKICNHPDLLLEEQLRNLPQEIKDFGASDRSAKLLVTLKILETWYQNKHRVVVFSQTVQILNILQQHMERLDYSFRRFDGKWSMHQRHKILQEFETDPTIFALLITTRVGGVGLNLTTANRLLIFDPDWNPVTDAQAKERSWRIGQKNDVIIYRLIVSGTIEEKIFQRQIFKYFLSQRVLVNPKQRRYFKMNDLEEFFQLPPKPVGWNASEEEQHSDSHYVQQLRDSIDSWGTYEGTKDYEGFFEENENANALQKNDRHQTVDAPMCNTTRPENSPVEIQIPKRKQRGATPPFETFSENANVVRNSHRRVHEKLFPPTSSRPKQQKRHNKNLIEYSGKHMASFSTSRESRLLATLQELQLVEGILSQDVFETSLTESKNVNPSGLNAGNLGLHKIMASNVNYPFISPAAEKKENLECTVSSLDGFSSCTNGPLVQENFKHLTPSENSVGTTRPLVEQWREGSGGKKLFEAWSRDLEEKLFNFLSHQGQCSTETLLEKFSSEVNTQHNPDECVGDDGEMSKTVQSEGSVPRTWTIREVLFASESLSSVIMLAVKVLGAGRHVGKSACLIEIDHCRVLLDCGIQVTASGMAKFPNLVSLYQRVEQSSVQQVSKSLSPSQHVGEKPIMDDRHMSCDDMLDTSSVGVKGAKEHNNTPPSSGTTIHSSGERRSFSSSYQCLVDVVLITHFHLDHVGALPILTEVLGYYGPILMTEATFRQAKLQLEDCWLNQTSSRDNINLASVSCEVPSNDSSVSHDAIDFWYSHSEEGEVEAGHDTDLSTWKKDGEFPRYWEASLDYEMIQSCLSKITRVSFSDPIQMKTLQITLLAAGHVPGACMFQIEGLQTGHSVLYTGDFTTNGEQVIPVAQAIRTTKSLNFISVVSRQVPQLHPTLLVSEGTYASQVRESKRAVERDLCCAVENAVRRGGNVLIPISALGKAQELALILSLHWKACHLTFPIVLASGMMEKAFSALKESGASLLPHVHEALDFISFMDVKRVLECAQRTPLVYFCSPRSLQAGSSLQMLHAWGNNPLNLILLLGYSLPSTIAHEIIKGRKFLDLPLPSHALLHNNVYPEDSNDHKSFNDINQHTPTQTQPFVLLAKMRYYSLGSHADSLAIQTFLQYASPLMTLLVHGEGTGLATLAQHLNQTVQRPTLAPENNDVIIVHSGSVPPPLQVTPLQHQLQSFMEQLDLSFSSSSSSGGSEFNLHTLSLSKAVQQQFGLTNKWISSQWSRSALKSFRPVPPFEQNKINCEPLFQKWCPSLSSHLESTFPLFLSLDLIEKQFIQDVIQKNTHPTLPSALVNDKQHSSTSKLTRQSFFPQNQPDIPSTMRRNISQPFISPSFSQPITSSKHAEKDNQEDQEEKNEKEEEEEEEGEIRFEKKIS